MRTGSRGDSGKGRMQSQHFSGLSTHDWCCVFPLPTESAEFAVEDEICAESHGSEEKSEPVGVPIFVVGQVEQEPGDRANMMPTAQPRMPPAERKLANRSFGKRRWGIDCETV